MTVDLDRIENMLQQVGIAPGDDVLALVAELRAAREFIKQVRKYRYHEFYDDFAAYDQAVKGDSDAG